MTVDTLADHLSSWPVEAAAVAVIEGERTVTHATDDDPQRRYRWASVTKVVTALTVLDVCVDGLLSLDTAAGPDGATLRHLLAHASGIAMDSDRVLARPGTRRIYSNRGIEIAADLAAEHTGESFEALMTERVLEPLGMHGCRLEGSPAHGITGTVTDLTALAAELSNSSQLLPGVVAAASTIAFPGLSGVLPGLGRQESNDWGLGCEIRDHKTPHWTSPLNSPATFGHFGQSGSFLWVDPDAGLAAVGLSDTAFGDWAVQAWPTLATAVVEASRR